MTTFPETFVLGKEIWLFLTFIGEIRFGCYGFFYGSLEIVVYLPFGFNQVFSGLTQEKRRMIGRHDRDVMPGKPFSPVVHDAGRMTIEILEGYFTEADDDFWLYQFDFLHQMNIGAGLPFFQGRGPVIFGTAFDNVGHIYMVPGQTDTPQSLIEELARWAHEGNAVFIFDAARSFADEHER